jgi:phage regulator Rha-like protein
MNNIVEIRKNEAVVESTIVAKGVGNEHRAVLQLIRQYENELKEFGTLAFEMRKSKGRPQEIYMLNEPQVYFLMTLMRNNEIVTRFKVALVKEFIKMRKTLINLEIMHQDKQWQQARIEGKAIRREETDVIKSFVEYAVIQGSTNAVRYYSKISKFTMERISSWKRN